MRRTAAPLHCNRFRYYDPFIGRYISVDPIGQVGGYHVYDYASLNPTSRSDPHGLWDVGGGFSFSFAPYSASVSVTTQICCDDQGRKHRRAVQSVCTGFSIGLSIASGGGPGGGNFSFGGQVPRCQGSPGNPYDQATGFGFSAALVVGAAWSSDDPLATSITTGLGGSLDFAGHCTTSVLADVIVGTCCNAQ